MSNRVTMVQTGKNPPRNFLDEIPNNTWWPKKSKPLPIFQKIVLKIANEIRFLRKVKVWIKHYNIIHL